MFYFGAIPPSLSLSRSAVVCGLLLTDVYNARCFLPRTCRAGSPARLLLTYSCDALLCSRVQRALRNFPLLHVGWDRVVKSRTAVVVWCKMPTPRYWLERPCLTSTPHQLSSAHPSGRTPLRNRNRAARMAEGRCSLGNGAAWNIVYRNRSTRCLNMPWEFPWVARGPCTCVCRHASSYWMAVSSFCCTNSVLFGVLPTNTLHSRWRRVPALPYNCSRQLGWVVSSKHSTAAVAGWVMFMLHREAPALCRLWSAAAR